MLKGLLYKAEIQKFFLSEKSTGNTLEYILSCTNCKKFQELPYYIRRNIYSDAYSGQVALQVFPLNQENGP